MDRVGAVVGIGHSDSVVVIAADDVASPGRTASNLAFADGFEVDALSQVAHCCCAGRVGADAVALDDIAHRVDAGGINTVQVAGNQIAGSRAGSPNRVGASADEIDARIDVAQRLCAGDIRADAVALHHAERTIVEENATAARIIFDGAVAGNHVPRRAGGTTDDAGRLTHRVNKDARMHVAAPLRAGSVRADKVTLNEQAGRVSVEDAKADVARDQVARRWSEAADDGVADRGGSEKNAVVVAERRVAIHIQPDETAFNQKACAARDLHATRSKLADGQPAHHTVVRRDDEAGGTRRVLPVEPDFDHGIVALRKSVGARAGLRVAVNRHRLVNHRQSRERRDGVRAGPGDVEADEVVRRVGGGGVVQDRLP